MGYIRGADRNAVLLFPECVEDYINDDNPVRFVDAFVESLDLVELGFERAMNQRYFLMRSLRKVGTEMSLTVLSYNIKRTISIIGVKKMIEAVT